jgi:hypothetical protein
LQHETTTGRRGPAERSWWLMKSKFLTTAAAAKYCACSASTFAKFRRFGRGPVFLKLGRRILYRVQDLDTWVESSRHTRLDQPVARTGETTVAA